MSGHAVTDDSDDETEIATCELECEGHIVTVKEALRALKTDTQYYDAHGSDETLDVNLFSVEKVPQRRLSSSTKQMNITEFLK
jgi:hypothetical protein